MKVDWIKFEQELTGKFTAHLKEGELTHALVLMVSEMTTEAIRMYHELVANAEQDVSQSE
ncbi:MAG: hypothetical protein M0R49_09970 [Limnochordia bacterium]|nr:hypothetical protein [Limnochordia bacterium]